MAFTQNTNNQTKFFVGNGAISWSEMRTNFNGPSGAIRFSDYYRNTDPEETNPIVPDATENVMQGYYPPSGNAFTNPLSAGDFRGSIDEYFVTLNSGTTEEQTDVDQLGWNSNLSKNVPKQFRVEGVAASDDNGANEGDAALQFKASARNLEFRISGQVYGARGTGGSANCGSGSRGGDAIFLDNIAPNSNASGRAKVVIAGNANARIWGGGGGGGAGNAGNTGPQLSCNFNSSYNKTVYNGGSTTPQRGCNAGYCPNTRTVNGVTGNLTSQNCFGQGGQRGRCRRRMERGQQCVNVYKRACKYSHNYKVPGGSGGNGGNGGNGQGWGGNNLVAANNGNSGGSGNNNTCFGQNSVGNPGNSGAAGGQAGSKGGNSCGNGGPAGRAVYKNNGNNYTVSGGSSNKLKGST